MKSLPLIQPFETVVVAHGEFPKHHEALKALRNARQVICCDGAIDNLLQFGIEPTYIVGDLDSILPEFATRFSDKLIHISEQDSNDLTKSIRFCKSNNYNNITILAATGKREDHMLGNIALLAEYVDEVNVQMLTDYGVLIPIKNSTTFESFIGQQVSIFSLTPGTKITTENLRYAISNSTLDALWMGTLNEALGASFTLNFSDGKLIVFREHYIMLK